MLTYHCYGLFQIAHLGALCCGLGLCNQHTLVLFVVPTALWVLVQLHSDRVGLARLSFTSMRICTEAPSCTK